MHFEIFRPTNAYAFQLLDDNNQLLLTSRTYPDLDACTEGIRMFVQLAATRTNFMTSAENGSYVYMLQANGQELARSVAYGSDANALEAADDLAETMAETTDYEVTYTEIATQAVQRPAFTVDLDSYDFTQASRSGALGFEAFQNAKNNLYYFHFNDAGGQAYLYSQAYSSENTRDNGIRSVIQNADKKERYELKEEAGKYYFILKAVNGREVARSRSFASATERDQAIAALQTHAGTFAEQYKKPEKPRTRNGNPPVDKYNFTVLSKSEQAGFESFQQPADKHHYFHFNNASGKAILYSQGYGNVAGRDNGIRSVIKNAYIDARYQRGEENEKSYFILKAGNNQEIARSSFFDSAAEMEAAIAYLKSQSVTYASRYQVELHTEETQTVETQRFNIHIDRPEPEVTNTLNRNIDQYDFTQKSPLGMKGFETFYSEKNQAYYFHFNDEDGNPILFSESYPNAAVRDNGLESVKKNAPLENRWKVLHENGKYFYALRAGNNQEIARGPLYDTEALALSKLSFIRSNEAGAMAALAAGAVAVLPGLMPNVTTNNTPAVAETPVMEEKIVSPEPVKLVDIPVPVKKPEPIPMAFAEPVVPTPAPVEEPVALAAVTETTTSRSRVGWLVGGVAAAAIIGGFWWYNNQTPPISVSSSVPQAIETGIQANTAEPAVAEPAPEAPATIENFQPIALYFNNDQPNPRTQTPTTTLTYGETFSDYYKQKGIFEREYSSGTTDSPNARQEINSFFDGRVKKGYDDLLTLSDKLLEKLQAGSKVEITVTGFASPLATGDYNKMLTGRRVSSIENHFRTYKNGQFKDYMDKGMLVITEQTSGEEQANQTISDDRTDTRSSWYSPSASAERRVEITNVTISKPQ
jgi:uncharacterized protein YegP (UPF0339 family)